MKVDVKIVPNIQKKKILKGWNTRSNVFTHSIRYMLFVAFWSMAFLSLILPSKRILKLYMWQRAPNFFKIFLETESLQSKQMALAQMIWDYASLLLYKMSPSGIHVINQTYCTYMVLATLIIGEKLCQTKINKFCIKVLVKKDVGCFDVSMSMHGCKSSWR